MAYFLKQSNLKKGAYLQIYESFYNREKKQTAHWLALLLFLVSALRALSSGLKLS
jgi:hypothetical protein